jgi:hypothetical protein
MATLMNRYKKIFLLSLISFVLIFLANAVNRNTKLDPINITKQDVALNLSSKFLSFFSLGHQLFLADLLWISTIIESDIDHYKNDDLNSWMYLRFNSIANLDPKFLLNYQFGVQYLSVIKDDNEGAINLLEKGLTFHPNDYSLNFTGGFVYAYEVKNYKRASELYEKIQNYKQAPPLLKSLAAKLKYESNGNLEETYSLIYLMYKSSEDKYLKEKFKKDLYSIKAEIDLKCLNSDRTDCDTKDFLENKYIKKGNTYVAPMVFNKYQLYK